MYLNDERGWVNGEFMMLEEGDTIADVEPVMTIPSTPTPTRVFPTATPTPTQTPTTTYTPTPTQTEPI